MNVEVIKCRECKIKMVTSKELEFGEGCNKCNKKLEKERKKNDEIISNTTHNS